MSSYALVTTVASGAASVSLIAANDHRRGLIIANNDTGILHVDLSGGTATATTANSFQLATLTHQVLDGYKGPATGIWSSQGAGSAQITELM